MMEKLIDCQWFCALFCYALLEQGGCLVMTQLFSKFIPCEKLLSKNALDQSSVGFVSGSCNCAVPWHTSRLTVLKADCHYLCSG